MDLVNQSSHQAAAPAPHAGSKRPEKKKLGGKLMKVVSVILLVSATVLLASLAVYLSLGGPTRESEYVDSSKYQAVFLNSTTQPPYFGKIRSINSKYMTLDNIYYLLVNQQVQPSGSSSTSQDVKLVKLGCELHAPYDTMVINRDQVLYWENLKDDSQVVQAITKYVQANPNGQKCETPAASSSSSSTTTKQ